uniref:Uncharacterized protein n=1 Tax=Kalanchoe fedtschenkoi TaxID=63787 RepID=A0A7N0T0D8_KALFE
MAASGLLRRMEKFGFAYEVALRLISVLLWVQLAAELPDLMNIMLALEDAEFSIMVDESAAVLGFISNPAIDLASLRISNLQTLAAGRNGSPSITALLREREMIKFSVDENFRMLSKGKGLMSEGALDGIYRSIEVGQSSGQAPGQKGGVDSGHGGQGPSDVLSPQAASSSSSSSSAGVEPRPRTRLNSAAQAFVPVISMNRGLEEERCLYLTFSNGHPLTSSDIANFFRAMCSMVGGWRENPRAVETVYVHGEEDGRALFGKVVFCNPYLPAFFLGRQREVKFILDGKPLWCKRFVPKGIRNNALEQRLQGEAAQLRPYGGGGGYSFRGQVQGIVHSGGSSVNVRPQGTSSVSTGAGVGHGQGGRGGGMGSTYAAIVTMGLGHQGGQNREMGRRGPGGAGRGTGQRGDQQPTIGRGSPGARAQGRGQGRPNQGTARGTQKVNMYCS